MSATFRLSKKKVSQDDLRRLMTDHKEKLQSQKVKKIDSPLAKYNETGQLMCILCKSIVRSENVWNVHINTKQHKENIEYAKKLKVQTQNFTTIPKVTANAFKRPAPASPHSGQSKRIKGILKNSQSLTKVPADFFDLEGSSASVNKDIESSQLVTQTEETEIPEHNPKEEIPEEPAPETEDPEEGEEVLPEGFFDDPKMDAKARNVQYKDPIEEEWEKFQKEMKEETSVSAAIIAGEHEEATAERQIDEIDEQIRNWSRVLDLERKKEEAKTQKDLENTAAMDCDRPSSEDEDDFDEYLDWRAKKSYR